MTMKSNNLWFDFLLREWLLSCSVLGLAATSLFLKRPPRFPISELQVLFLLWVMFITVKGLQNSGLILRLSQNIERGRLVPLKLISTTFILSMVVTNDVAVIIIVPLTLSLNTSRKGILVILEAFAANAGSALTPFGNPQNLFIYWFYHVHPLDFITCIAPLSIAFLTLILLSSLVVRTRSDRERQIRKPVTGRAACIYGGMLIVVVLTVLRVLPVAAAALVLIYALLFDRKALRVDYGLLFAFLCFFGLAENIRILLTSRLEHSEHIFLLSAVSSQIMSNVPAALLIAKFTTKWKALLWGTNVGGYGNLVSSFANLIAYRYYILHKGRHSTASFTVKFVGLGYVMFFMGMGLYWAVQRWF